MTNRHQKPDHTNESLTNPKPGTFKLGSLESRAAARALIKSKPKTVIRVVFVGKNRSGEPLPPSKAIPGSNALIEYAYDDEPTSGDTSR